ncbi:glycosyltransferase family 4 protein [Patescibacteria group bacterium]|nr:glycosyltransferase family 4 protein [Patescibacteria group bacterium]MBU1895890.1 glycosyltransferase family 4 protein [Patescibacteria group bacterium]
MKICIIENIYPPYDRGGAEQVVSKTVQGLLSDGHEVVIITSCPQGNIIERDGKLTIYRRRPKNIYFYTEGHEHAIVSRIIWHIIDIFNIFTSRWVEGILKKEKPDVVHTHNLMGLSFLIPRVIKRVGLRHVHTVHDVQLVEPSAMILKAQENDWRYTGFPTKIYTWVMKNMIGSPQVVISPSKFLLDFYQSRGFFPKSKCEVLRNPITFDYSTPRLFKEKDSVCRFLYLGQIESHKGVTLLVEAFKKLIDQKQNCELHVAGSGSGLIELKKSVEGNDKIKIYGRVDRSKLPELFSQMDATVVPSLCYENSPTVIFESLYFGVPVLASHIEGIAELIKEGENGLTFESGNADLLLQKMGWCLEHRTELGEMSKKTTQSLVGLSQGEYISRLISLYG